MIGTFLVFSYNCKMDYIIEQEWYSYNNYSPEVFLTKTHGKLRAIEYKWVQKEWLTTCE